MLSNDYEAMAGEGEQVYRNKTLEVSGMASKIYKAFQNEPVRMRERQLVDWVWSTGGDKSPQMVL